jgi:hypothetical protein
MSLHIRLDSKTTLIGRGAMPWGEPCTKQSLDMGDQGTNELILSIIET